MTSHKNLFRIDRLALVRVTCLSPLLAPALASHLAYSKVAAAENTLKILTYNVENLFDAEDDAEINDAQYLPIDHPDKEAGCKEAEPKYKERCLRTDWTKRKSDIKIEQLGKALRSAAHDHGTSEAWDVMAFVEIEKDVLAQAVSKEAFMDVSFLTFITEGRDKRGINNALVIKKDSPLKGCQKLEDINVSRKNDDHPTRNILEVVCDLVSSNGSKTPIHFFVNHWASVGSNQMQTAEQRQYAAKILKNRSAELQKEEPDTLLVALGDFNTPRNDWTTEYVENERNPKKKVMYHHAILSILDHDGEGRLHSLSEELVRAGVEKKYGMSVLDSIKFDRDRGTYYVPHLDCWSDIDLILVSPNLLPKSETDQGWTVNMKSFTQHSNSELMHFYKFGNTPSLRYAPNSGILETLGRDELTDKNADKFGYSDHLPVSVYLTYQ